MPVVKEHLKILEIEMQIKSAHSRISLADILSRPGAFNLLSLFSSKSTWVLTIYTGKPEILVGRSNGSRHSVWEASENLGFDLW